MAPWSMNSCHSGYGQSRAKSMPLGCVFGRNGQAVQLPIRPEQIHNFDQGGTVCAITGGQIRKLLGAALAAHGYSPAAWIDLAALYAQIDEPAQTVPARDEHESLVGFRATARAQPRQALDSAPVDSCEALFAQNLIAAGAPNGR